MRFSRHSLRQQWIIGLDETYILQAFPAHVDFDVGMKAAFHRAS